LVLDADLRQAVVAVRSLGRAGLSVGAVASVPRAPAFNSRWCRRSWLVPDPTDGERLRWALLALLEREPAAVIIPLHDGTIEALRAGRAEVASRTAVALAPEPGLGVAVDKERTLEAARGLGLTVPRGALIADPQETAAALGETGLPAVVKPVRSWVASDDGAARLASTGAKDAAAVARAVEAVTAAGGRALVQEWLPGRREAVSLLYAHDRVWARFAQVAHRMAPALGGSSVLRVSIQPPPDADAAAERLVRQVGLEGYSEVEFRRDREGRPALMEVNPRLSASVEVAVRAGVDFPLLLQRWAAGEALRPVAGYRLGVRMRWLGGDLSRLAEAARGQRGPDTPPLGRELAVAVRDTLRPSGYDYVDPGDLRPALVAAGTKLAAYGTRAARRIRGAGNAG
jgi:predicted ATP-grasp superfamily ATP-dependent carboligase